MYPPSSHTEKVAQKDDVIPLRLPVTGPDGRKITSIPIRKGQVSGPSFLSSYSQETEHILVDICAKYCGQ